MKRVGIIICDRYHTCAGGKCLRSLRELHWPQARRSALKRLTDAIQWGVKLRCERRAMLRCRGRIIAIDDLCKRELCEAYGLQDSEVFVAYNGVDHERFNPESARPWREELRGQHGIADDALSTALLTFDCPCFVAPAMNSRMWKHPATVENVRRLKERGVVFIGPAEGPLACRDEEGPGRMAEPAEIVERLEEFFRAGKRS